MRQFETIHNFVDNEGYPISGDRVSFYVNGTQTLASIKDSDGNSLSNPIAIVMGHTAKQVFLPDSDIKIVWERCVDSVDDSWESVKSWIDKFNVVPVNVTGGIPIVNTVDEMLALDPSVGVVNLMGYYSAGDKPLVVYRWKSSRHFNADGGAIISNRVDGYWGANFDSDFVDVRHYGVFPQADALDAQGIKINQVYNSVKLLGKSLYFPVSEYNTIYEVGGCNISGCKADVGVRFISNGNDSEFRNCTNVYAKAGSGKITIVGDVLKTSQNVDTSDKVILEPKKTIILDTQYRSGITWNGVEVNLSANQENGATFKSCTFSGKGKLKSGSYVFDGCEIRESIFDSSYDVGTAIFTNCESSYILWDNWSKFFKFCNLNSNKIIDLGGNTYGGAVVIPAGCTVKNAKLTSAVALANNVSVVDCEIALYSQSGVSLEGVSIVNSTITSDALNATSLKAVNSKFTKDVVAESIVARDCNFEKNVVTKNCTLDNCIFGGNVQVRPSEDVVKDLRVVGCTFADSKKIKIDAENTYQVNGGIICNNILLGDVRNLIDTGSYFGNPIKTWCYTSNIGELESYTSTDASMTVNGTLRARMLSGYEACYFSGLQNLAIDVDSVILNPTASQKESFENGSVIFENYETGKYAMYLKMSGGWYKLG